MEEDFISSFKSIFDIIEEKSLTPEPFVWSKNPAHLIYQPSEILHEGKLFTIKNVNNNLKCKKYILTQHSLFKFKDPSSKFPTKVLRLKNPRVQKINDPSTTLYFP